MESNKKKKPTNIQEMSKEQIRQAVIKKRECNAKAQQIVESLLENSVTEHYLLQCLPEINQNHFEDVIEERSITHLCGYPLCDKKIQNSNIPKQKYRISLKTNKVYDITARKNFCSNTCYKSAMYIKKQMLTSPLWFRDYEDIPDFHILRLDSVGSLGQEIDLTYIEKLDVNYLDKQFTSINDFASASLGDMSQNNVCNNISIDVSIKDTNTQGTDQLEQKLSNLQNEVSRDNTCDLGYDDQGLKREQDTECTDKITEENNKSKVKPNSLSIVGEIIEKPEKKIDPIIAEMQQTTCKNKSLKRLSKIPQKKQHSITAITIEVEKCLAEWFTLDTIIFIFGEDRVREMVADKGECIKEYFNNYAKGIFYTSNSYDQYQALCRKLNMLELEDRKFDAQTLNKETKPLPDYSILKEESKRLQLKVKAFLAGDTDIPKPQPEPETNDETENLTQLPLVDKHAQNALRRKIVCQHLNKVLPDILRSLGLLSLTISTDVRLIVNTFKLNANNIMFKPIQWTLIAIVMVKLLSLRDGRLHHLLEQQTAFQHMQLLLLSYKQDGGYLERLVEWLVDIDRLLDTNNTQLTIG